MSISTFRVKYGRPNKLSDPHNDFTDDLLKELLAIPDSQLKRRHYVNLLGPHLPAGTYQESVYFLPLAFQYLATHDEETLDLINPIIGFISKNKNHLSADVIWDAARDCIRECFHLWTQKFCVVHFDTEACREKGWRITYFDTVKNSETVEMAIKTLVEFEHTADLAAEFISKLALSTDDPVKSAWFLEYIRSQSAPYYKVPDYEPIKKLIYDEESVLKAAILVEEKIVPNEPSPTYWQDTFKILGLA